MFSSGELIVIFLLALIVLGPSRLPAVARTLAIFFRNLKALFFDVRKSAERYLELDKLDTDHSVEDKLTNKDKTDP